MDGGMVGGKEGIEEDAAPGVSLSFAYLRQ